MYQTDTTQTTVGRKLIDDSEKASCLVRKNDGVPA